MRVGTVRESRFLEGLEKANWFKLSVGLKNRGLNYSVWLVKGIYVWFELSVISKNWGFEKSGFHCNRLYRLYCMEGCLLVVDIPQPLKSSSSVILTHCSTLYLNHLELWVTHLLKVTRPSFFLGGYHPTLKLSGIPTFTFIVSLIHRMDNI